MKVGGRGPGEYWGRMLGGCERGVGLSLAVFRGEQTGGDSGIVQYLKPSHCKSRSRCGVSVQGMDDLAACSLPCRPR